MLYLNENEEKIIGNFMDREGEFENKDLILKWKDGSQIIAKYDSFIEDESDNEIEDEKYEEFWSFVFQKIKVIGTPPINISEDNYFLINYHNFPDEILLNDIRIN